MIAPENDWRLNAIEKRLERFEPIGVDVAVLKNEMINLTRVVAANTRATEELADQLEGVQIEPTKRALHRHDQLFVAMAGALTGGLVGLIAALIASHG